MTAQGWDRTEWTMLGAGVVSAAVRAGATYEKRKPSRAARVESDVLVPLYQSLVSGLVGGVAVGTVAGLAGVGSLQAVLTGVVGSAGAMGLTWAVLLREHRAALWEIERIVGRDLDDDGIVGDPESVVGQKPNPIQVEVIERDRAWHLRMMRFVELPVSVTDEDMVRVARALIVERRAFARRKLTDILTDDVYTALAHVLLRGKLLEFRNRKNDRNGYMLTPSGRALMQRYVVVGGGGGGGGTG